MPQNLLGAQDESIYFVLGGWLHRGIVGFDREARVYYFAGEDGQRSATAQTLPELAALLAERRAPRRIAVNLVRNNVRAIRAVLNAGESVAEFVRIAALGEVARRRLEDHEALYGQPDGGE